MITTFSGLDSMSEFTFYEIVFISWLLNLTLFNFMLTVLNKSWSFNNIHLLVS